MLTKCSSPYTLTYICTESIAFESLPLPPRRYGIHAALGPHKSQVLATTDEMPDILYTYPIALLHTSFVACHATLLLLVWQYIR